MRRSEHGRQKRTRRVFAVLLVGSLLLAWSPLDGLAQPKPSEPGMRKPPKSAMPAKPGAAGQATAALPKFPQKFDVQGPESDSFGFAVTQPGPIAVDVQVQGPPVVVTLQSPGGQPIVQQGSGLLRLFYNTTPQDVQRSLFWQVQIKAWCEDDCLTSGKRPRATGFVNVQHPPVNQAAVQKAVQAMTAQQTQPPQPDPAQAAALAAQMEQAFQQRKAQFEQLQQQRRAALFAQIQPQLDQLRLRTGTLGTSPAWTKGGGASLGSVRPRGLEPAEGIPDDPDGASSRPAPDLAAKADDALRGEQGYPEGEIGTRAMPTMRGRTESSGPRGTQPITFPQGFAIQGQESASFAFGVTQPGPIQVEVQTQGPPVVVSLQHLPSPPMSQQGSGPIRLSYEVTPQDIQKSALWVVRVRPVQPSPPANGTVMVQHPPADHSVVQTQTAVLAEQERVRQARTEAETDAHSRAEFQEFKARFEQQYQQRLAAERAQNQALLKRLRPQSGGMIRSRGLNPAITKVNKNEGQPRTQVIIEGTNFGSGGEVVFQLGPNIMGMGIVEAWADTVVVANVPDASGLLPYQGTVAIKVGQTMSNTIPFKFIPVEEVREIRSAQGQDVSLADPGIMTGSKIEHPNNSFGQLAGSRGNDIFFPARQLSNGWVVQEIKLKIDPCAYPNCRGGYVADSRLRTPSPFFNVRWWHEALVGARYWFSLWIVGPRGVPDGIALTGPLMPVVPPGTPPPATTASNTPGGRTPPSQPPYTPPASSQPIEMTVVPINPALLIPQYQAPGSGTATQGTATANQPPNVTTTTPPSGTMTQPPANPPSQPASTNPLITSLSVPQGQPGDPVMITGSNFGPGLGEIHFVIAPGKDLVAPAGAIWSDNQIFTSVPDATGVLGFNGQVYIKRSADQRMSNLVSFRFEPILEMRAIRATMDRVLKWPVAPDSSPDEVKHTSNNWLAGYKDNDVLFGNTRLKNGWVADQAFVYCRDDGNISCNGGAYVWEIKKGTDWPYLNVRWWTIPADFNHWYAHVWYRFAVHLIGPKGTPDGVVVP